ncbi:hypothetical protein [Pyxidicoccus xibeiensis]|uniref:hypothetical protein n=1 Tax=Pyxidicoccus xibeiensis TaxID=2906759 RepID=UPI0020A751DD|nr:hypothetical protein [Pyxidicoccus xibeiensis]MCP3145319.1 hypothetical protein [Pyxidicoccus xibeiensis]
MPCLRHPPQPHTRPPPPYLSPPRGPKDAETLPPLTLFNRTSLVVKGARVYQLPDGSHRHLDTLHKGRGAEIETYNGRGHHMGAICPQCGALKPGSIVPGRRLER